MRHSPTSGGGGVQLNRLIVWLYSLCLCESLSCSSTSFLFGLQTKCFTIECHCRMFADSHDGGVLKQNMIESTSYQIEIPKCRVRIWSLSFSVIKDTCFYWFVIIFCPLLSIWLPNFKQEVETRRKGEMAKLIRFIVQVTFIRHSMQLSFLLQSLLKEQRPLAHKWFEGIVAE